MVGLAEGAPVRERTAFQLAGHRLDHRDFEKFARTERRQDRGKPRGEHRFARARWAVHQQVVPSGGGDFERSLGAFLALDVAKVGQASRARGHGRFGPGHHLASLEMIGQLNQRTRGQHVHIAAGPGCLGSRRRWADQAKSSRIRRHRGGQDAVHRRDRAVESELTKNAVPGERIGWDRADGGHHREGDGKVVMRAFLRQVRRSEVDGDALCRKRQSRCDQRGAHALARFRYGFVRQPHHHEHHRPRGDLDLDVDGARLDPLEGDCGDAGDHGSRPLSL